MGGAGRLQEEEYDEAGLITKYLLTEPVEGRRLLEVRSSSLSSVPALTPPLRRPRLTCHRVPPPAH